MNPLIQAVQEGNIELVRELLERGDDVNVQEEAGWSPLHNAVEEGSLAIVQLLLDKGADLHIKKKNGATPFIVAGIVGNVKLLELFLSNGANINEYDNHGFTAFMEAAWYGHVDALEYLYKKGAQVNLGRQTSEEQKKLGKGGTTALMDAAEQGHLDVLKILLTDMGADVNACDNKGRNALIYSFKKPQNKKVKEIIRFLLDCEVDVNVRGEKGKTPLILAVEMEDFELVELMLKRDGTDINETDKDGNTALLVAVEKEHVDIARLLCENGAHLDCGDLIGIAQRKYDRKMIKLLRDYGASENFHSPCKVYEPNSQRWRNPLIHLSSIYRPMIGKLKIFIQEEYRIAETSEGGVYLGFYDGKEAAVKRFSEDSQRAQQEITCINHCQMNSNLVTFYGRESQKDCLYLCFALCERTLEEHLTGQREALLEKDFQNILKSLFKAVQELHRNNYTHQDLHPGNILIDSRNEVCLIDFDKSEQLDESRQKIKDDLKALGRLVLYVVQEGKDPFENIKAPNNTKIINACKNKDIEDLVQNLLNPGEECENQLSDLLSHPFFWNCETRYRFLRNVGNESDIKIRNPQSKILQELNQTTAYEYWREKIDKDVMKIMNDFYKKKSEHLRYNETVGDLLKFIRNIGEHFEEKRYKKVKSKIMEPSQYFQNLFPDLVIYVYDKLRNMKHTKHFPSVNSS